MKFGYNNPYGIIVFLPSLHLERVQAATTKVIKGLTRSGRAEKPYVDGPIKLVWRELFEFKTQDTG